MAGGSKKVTYLNKPAAERQRSAAGLFKYVTFLLPPATKGSINSNNDSYSATDKSFTDEHITSDNPNKTVSDSEITGEHITSDSPNKTASDSEFTINSMEHHLPDSITSVENLNVKTCDCITKLGSLKDQFNLKVVNIKKTWV